jgi:hypothetical protein
MIFLNYPLKFMAERKKKKNKREKEDRNEGRLGFTRMVTERFKIEFEIQFRHMRSNSKFGSDSFV